MSGAQLVVFPFLLLMLPIMAALAWWLKRRYSAAIVRLQREADSLGTAQRDSATGPASVPNVAPRTPPQLTLFIRAAHEVPIGSNGVDETAAHRRLRHRVLSVQGWSGLVYWGVLLLFLAAAIGGTLDVVGVLMFTGPSLLLFLLLPSVVAWVLQAGLQRTLMNIAAAVVFISGFGLLLSEGRWESAIGFSFGYASIALMVSAFMRPSIRGAGLPLIIAGIAGWLVLTGMFAVALAFDDSTDDAVGFAEVVIGVVVLMLMLGIAVWCGWRTLLQLSVSYEAKRFSDTQLALGAYWALLTAFALGSVLKDPLLFVFNRLTPEWICVAIVSLWLVWRWLQSIVLRRAVRTAGPSIGALLFLRVFKPSSRSEEFTDRFFAYWRFAGPVWMIAGPDLAGAHMEPNEFFAYLRGRLRDQFVTDPDEAITRVKALDNARDPDGRFRVNELLCTNSTWKPAVLHMVAHASVILLDLRQYSEQRKGTRFELTELLRRAPLDKVLLLIDAKEDVARFKAVAESIWREVGGCRDDVAGLADLQVLRFSKGSNAEMHGLFRATVRAATA